MFDNFQKLNKNRVGRNFISGFTLFELLVTISIAVIVTAISFANLPNYSSKLSLELLAQDIAISIRQAQVYGTTIYGTPGGVGQQVFQAYGVHFPEVPTVWVPGQYKYALFADLLSSFSSLGLPTNDNKYEGFEDFTACGEPKDDNECLETFFITGTREEIVGLCKNFFPADGGSPYFKDRWDNCLIGGVSRLKSLDIVFTRPNLAANFSWTDSMGEGAGSISNVGILVISPKIDYRRAIVVWSNGQISIDKE